MLHLMFHDDWEINGDGTGDPRTLMFEPARKLLDLCDRYGARYTLFAEVMQQFAMKRSSEQTHREWADEWEEILRDAIRRGHDVQLHIHPQWTGAQFAGQRWRLDHSKWSIADLDGEDAFRLLSRGKAYLESLLRPVRADYEVVAFRAGGWMAQPSGELIKALRKSGISADCSVVPGKRITYRDHSDIDYRHACHRLLPWWTGAQDVAAAGDGESALVELPAYAEAFRIPLPLHLLRRNLRGIPHYGKIHRRRQQRERTREFTPANGSAGSGSRWQRFFAPRATYCSFGYIHYRTLMAMVGNARRLSRSHGVPDAPLVMLTHSKSFFSYPNFEKTLQRLATDKDLTFVRTRDCVRDLRSGAFAGLPLATEATPGRRASQAISGC